jgi:hypothetical protein
MGSRQQMLLQYKKMSPQEQDAFSRWLRLNAVLGSMIAMGLVAMALAGSIDSRPGDEIAASGTTLAAHALPGGRPSQR